MPLIKKNTLCLKEKMELIHCFENENLSIRQLREKFKCGKTQVLNILKRRQEIKDMWKKGTRGDMMKKKRCNNEEINKLVWEWFVDAKSQNLPVSGPLLQSQAKMIAEKLGNYTFKASNGWLESFRKRNNIVGSEVRDELKGINQEYIDDWKKKVPSIIQCYKPEDVFSGSETGLFFRELPDETIIIKEEKCDNGKQNKERLTLFLCCSLKGEKEIPLVIGKTAKPRCFENLCLTKLPVLWKSSKNALMTSEIMKEWLESFDEKMQTQKRNVLLFLNNPTTSNVELKNVKLIILPKSTVHQTQPLYQGIIENLKTYYRKLCIQSVHTRMTTCKSVNELSRSITILDAILWISSSWNSVKEAIIESCFQKAGFPSNNNDYCETIDDNIKTMNEFITESFNNTSDAYQYVDIDKDISTIESINCLNESQSVNHDQPSNDSDNDEVEAKSVADKESKIETYADALKAINQIYEFSLLVNDGALFNFMNNSKSHVENVISCALIEKQKAINKLEEE